MATLFQRRATHYALLLGAAGLLFFWNLGAASLWDIDEGKNATCAFEMYESGRWVVPTFNGALRADKPALLYWLQAAAYHVFGVSVFSARLPSACAGLGAVLLAYELGRSLFGKTTGFFGALLALSSPLMIGAARFANPDALLHFFILLTLLLFWLGQDRPTSRWWAGLGAASGLGMLAKGPVAVLLPGLIMVVYLLWEGRWRIFIDRRWWWGGLTWALVALPWYVWVALDTKGRFLRGFFLRHHLDRFLGPLEGHDGSPAYYVLILLGGMLPWSLFLFGACWYGFWSALEKPNERWHTLWQRAAEHSAYGRCKRAPTAAYRFLLSWLAVYLVFFTTAATKLPNYVLPVVVPCAVLCARMLNRWRHGELQAPAWCMRAALGAWVAFGVVLALGLLFAGGALPLGILHDYTIPDLAPLAWLGVVPCLSAVLAWRLLLSRRRGAVLACLGAAAIATLAPLVARGQVAANQLKAPEPLIATTGACNRSEDLRIVACNLRQLPSLNFYAQRAVIHLENRTFILGYLHYPTRVFVFLRAEDWDWFQENHPGHGRLLARHRDLYSGRNIVVVTNQ